MDEFDFSEWLGDALNEKKMNHTTLAGMSGLNPQTIWYYLIGKRSPTLASLGLMLDALGKRIEIVDK